MILIAKRSTHNVLQAKRGNGRDLRRFRTSKSAFGAILWTAKFLAHTVRHSGWLILVTASVLIANNHQSLLFAQSPKATKDPPTGAFRRASGNASQKPRLPPGANPQLLAQLSLPFRGQIKNLPCRIAFQRLAESVNANFWFIPESNPSIPYQVKNQDSIWESMRSLAGNQALTVLPFGNTIIVGRTQTIADWYYRNRSLVWNQDQFDVHWDEGTTPKEAAKLLQQLDTKNSGRTPPNVFGHDLLPEVKWKNISSNLASSLLATANKGSSPKSKGASSQRMLDAYLRDCNRFILSQADRRAKIDPQTMRFSLRVKATAREIISSLANASGLKVVVDDDDLDVALNTVVEFDAKDETVRMLLDRVSKQSDLKIQMKDRTLIVSEPQ